MTDSHVGQVRRTELCATPVTLNGRPARISGTGLQWARVTDLETRLSAEWAWATVEHIVTRKGGKFYS